MKLHIIKKLLVVSALLASCLPAFAGTRYLLLAEKGSQPNSKPPSNIQMFTPATLNNLKSTYNLTLEMITTQNGYNYFKIGGSSDFNSVDYVIEVSPGIPLILENRAAALRFEKELLSAALYPNDGVFVMKDLADNNSKRALSVMYYADATHTKKSHHRLKAPLISVP